MVFKSCLGLKFHLLRIFNKNVFASELVHLENISEKWVEKSLKNEKLKKLDFYTSTKSISRNGYVMKEKKELLTNFKFFLIPMVQMLQEEIQSLYNYFFLKIV
jgi:hypothetical protein